MPNQEIALDRIFHALSDPTRMAVLSRLCDGPAPVSELAAPFDMALPSFTQHLRVLEDNGLVTSTKSGRVRTYRMRAESLDAARSWIDRRRELWERRLDQLDTYLASMKEQDR